MLTSQVIREKFDGYLEKTNMTTEELDDEESRFNAAVNAFIERCTQDWSEIAKDEAVLLHNKLQGAFSAYGEALRQRGRSVGSKEVGEAFFYEASKLTHEAFFRLFTSLMRYHKREAIPDTA